MPKWNRIDVEIFRGSDHPLDTKDEVYELFHERIEELLLPKSLKQMDRCEIVDVEVQVSMLYRLGTYYDNVVTTKEDVSRWMDVSLEFFDGESQERGDSENKEIKNWRENIRKNFKRLSGILHSKSEWEG